MPLDRVLESIAAFYADDVVARQVAAALTIGHGLSPRQVKLLSPGNARSRRLALLIPRWRRPDDDGRWRGFGVLGVAAALCLLLAGLVAAVWLAGELGAPSAEQMLSSLWALVAMLGVLAVVLFATVALTLSRRPTLPGQFDRTVQRQLAAGSWAVVVRGVSWTHQSGVLSLLGSASQSWCAAWPSSRRL